MADRLVADISPFLESLRQFTPRAQEDRQIQLEALGQQSQLRDLQLQNAQRTQRRQQMTDLATENRVSILEDISDLDFIIKGGPDQMRNTLAKLAAEKGEGHEDQEEIIQMVNLATTDPDEAFNKLKANREKAGRALSLVDRVLGTTAAPGFTLTEGATRFDAAGNVIATGQPKIQSGRDSLSQVQSSQILPDGSTVQVFRDGSTRVTGPDGKPLTGEDRANAVITAQEFGVDIQSRRAGGRAEATGEEKRASDLITRGIAAAESTAITRRALTLLDKVKTGGIAAISLATKQRLGIEGADEGELSNSLGKSVLSQLRETFGAAFTENEGLRLDRIEARFGKSPAANRRLLSQALRIAERTANRAIKAAKKRGNLAEVADIEDLLSFSLEIDETAPVQDTPKEEPKFLGFE